MDFKGIRTSPADMLIIFQCYLSGSRPIPSPRPAGHVWVKLLRQSAVYYHYPLRLPHYIVHQGKKNLEECGES
ncbi:hypothetical protein PoB_005043000 [Plakobranchus ocellatus]|uniref:Uncharacterized protein n=1 Tax=Plakobranchus ocellatus TaxID=259542 RepID=A0AAV4BXP0_9GAST|nr:hypothetical protein PoB_005043000 [Plakobranchus ocellatus]